jgi:hypothetical protein
MSFELQYKNWCQNKEGIFYFHWNPEKSLFQPIPTRNRGFLIYINPDWRQNVHLAESLLETASSLLEENQTAQTIYHYNPDEDRWTLLDARMKVEKVCFVRVAMMVDRDMFAWYLCKIQCTIQQFEELIFESVYDTLHTPSSRNHGFYGCPRAMLAPKGEPKGGWRDNITKRYPFRNHILNLPKKNLLSQGSFKCS